MLRIILACFFLWQAARPIADGADTQATPAYDPNRFKIEEYRRETIRLENRAIDEMNKLLKSRERPFRVGWQTFESRTKMYKHLRKRLLRLKQKHPVQLYFGQNRIFLAANHRNFRVDRLGYLRRCELIQIPEPGTMLASALDQFVLIKGFDTSRNVDGITLSFGTLMEVTGTHTYTSVAGSSKTVYVLEPFDVAPYSPRYGADASSSAYPASRKTRQFHHGSCRFGQKIKAKELVGYDTVTDAEFDGMRPCRRCKP